MDYAGRILVMTSLFMIILKQKQRKNKAELEIIPDINFLFSYKPEWPYVIFVFQLKFNCNCGVFLFVRLFASLCDLGQCFQFL